MKSPRPYVYIEFYSHKDFKYRPSPVEFWCETFGFSLYDIWNRERTGILIKESVYEEVFNYNFDTAYFDLLN